MISPAKKQVFISCGDGSRELFRPEELQSHIYSACLQCGFDDSWLSEDLALSVEYLLLEEGKKTEFSKDEIFLFASRLLEETGYSNIALRLRKNCGIKTIDEAGFGFDDGVNSFLVKCGYFGRDLKHIEHLSALVLSALKRLGIKNPGEDLILSLARYYTKNSEILDTVSKKAVRNGIIVVPKEELLERFLLSVKGISAWTTSGVLVFHPLSTLFPSLKISFSLAKFADMKGLIPLVTELAIMPHMEEIALLIDDMRRTVLSILSDYGVSGELPVILRITDSMSFAKEYMGSESGDDKFIKELFISLRDFVSCELIIK